MVRETSIKTYKEIIEEGLLSEQQEIVFRFFKEHPLSTDLECSQYTNLKINVVTGRRNELFNDGCLVEGVKVRSSITGRLSLTWYVPSIINFNK